MKGNKKDSISRIWDTAGQEDYERLRPLAYPNTNVCFIAFSIVLRDSFENVEKSWIKEFRQYMPTAQVKVPINIKPVTHLNIKDYPYWNKVRSGRSERFKESRWKYSKTHHQRGRR